MPQSIKCLLCKQEDLNLIPNSQVKNWVWLHMIVIPVLGR